ncbi:MAG TPA: flavin reductase family protein [Aggregatilineales bacterium]|nr:flavin reductase family protein [Aggregatilineales bacterium]
MSDKVTSLKMHDLEARAAHRLLTSIVTPRPIAWVSTVSPEGIYNLAPFSFFNAVAGSPPTVMISIGSRNDAPKDTLLNIEATGEFVVNLVDEAHAEAMNLTSANLPYGQNEFNIAGLEAVPSIEVRPPRVANVPVAMEAKLTQLVPVKDTYSTLVLGQVVCFHIRDGLLLPDGVVDSMKMHLISRLGGDGYTTMGDYFELGRPQVTR